LIKISQSKIKTIFNQKGGEIKGIGNLKEMEFSIRKEGGKENVE
jgi:hypothetical protein